MPWYKEHAQTIMTIMYFTNHVAFLGQIQFFKKARKCYTLFRQRKFRFIMSLTKIKSDRIILENGLFHGYIYLENGKILATGKHNTLLKNCELYKDIYNQQTKKGGK